jgi:hypothetical protein
VDGDLQWNLGPPFRANSRARADRYISDPTFGWPVRGGICTVRGAHDGFRDYADPEAAARKLVEPAASITPAQDGRIDIEKLNAPFLITLKAKGSEFSAGLKFAIERGWLERESGAYVRLKTEDPLAP